MLGNILDRHPLGELVDIASQSFRDPEGGIEEIEVFDRRSLALRAEDLPILTVEPYLSRSKIQISNRSLLVAVDSRRGTATKMAEGSESFVGNDFDPGSFCPFRDPLMDNSDSTKGEVLCYTQTGHRWPPLDNFVGDGHYYPLEIPDVQYYFAA